MRVTGRLRSAAAVVNAGRAIALAESNKQSPGYLPGFLLSRAEMNLTAERFEEARVDAERVLAIEEKGAPSEAYSSSIGRSNLTPGRALRAQGRLDEARAAGVSALRHLEPSLGADHPTTRDARRLAGAAF